MTANDAFDRTIAGWLKSDAESHQPMVRIDRVHDAVRDSRPLPAVLAALGSRWVGGAVGTRDGVGRTVFGLLSPTTLLVLLTVLAIAGGAALAAGQIPPLVPAIVTPTSTATAEPSLVPASYEAIFLRLDVVDGRPDVIVTGVSKAGREREVARLRNAWLLYDPISPSAFEFVPASGTVSSTGLLAMLGSQGEQQPAGCPPRCGYVHWEIFDLLDPDALPIVVPEIRGFFEGIPSSVFWGPRDQIVFRFPGETQARVSFVDGRTGRAESVSVQVVDPALDGNLVIEGWAADGSGILVNNEYLGDSVVLHPDGSVTTAPATPAEPHCQIRYRSGARLVIRDDLGGRLFLQDPEGGIEELPAEGGVGLACIAPDESMLLLQSGRLKSRLVTAEAEIVLENLGNFAGWMALKD